MAFGQVLARLGVLQVRRIGASRVRMVMGAAPAGPYADRSAR